MALTNDQITAQNFKDFYEQIRPYLNGSFPTPIVNAFARGDLYSTDEKIIGTASDGKPLYQKCFDIEAFNHPLDTGNSSRITLMASTGKKLINAFGYLWKSTGAMSVQIPSCSLTSGESPYIYYQTTVDETNGNFRLVYQRNDTSQVSFDKGGYVVLQYTKTGDSAIKVGSGTDYSTEEQIIGSWIDGKPLYQRTYIGNLTSMTSSQSTVVDASFIPSTHSLKKASGIIKSNGTDYTEFTLDSTLGSNGGFFVGSHSSTGLRITPQGNITWPSGGSYEITVRYTKSTD